MKAGYTGFKRLYHATIFSLKGIRFAWINESAFRQEISSLLVLMPLAFWLGETHIEQTLMIGSCFIVIIAELLNTAVEAVVDRIGPEYHDLAGSAKDLGSAGVFFAIILFLLTWALMLLN